MILKKRHEELQKQKGSSLEMAHATSYGALGHDDDEESRRPAHGAAHGGGGHGGGHGDHGHGDHFEFGEVGYITFYISLPPLQL